MPFKLCGKCTRIYIMISCELELLDRVIATSTSLVISLRTPENADDRGPKIWTDDGDEHWSLERSCSIVWKKWNEHRSLDWALIRSMHIASRIRKYTIHTLPLLHIPQPFWLKRRARCGRDGVHTFEVIRSARSRARAPRLSWRGCAWAHRSHRRLTPTAGY